MPNPFNVLSAVKPDLTVLALTLLVGMLTVGCQPGSRSEAPPEAALSDSLAEGYQWLEEQYEQMGTPMPPMMRGMQGRMQAMHGRMMDDGSAQQEGGDRMGGMKGRMMGERGGMMDRRGEGGASQDTTDGRARMGHGDMSAMHETMARMHGEQRARMAARHKKMARWHEQMMGGSTDESAQTRGESAQVPDDAARSGATLFAQQCASCHGQNGQGVSGAFPPLTGSEWVTGDVSVLARIVLHGLEGPLEVDGERYDGVMPAFGTRLSNPEVAKLLTFLRTSLNEEGSSVTAEEIAGIRESYDRSRAWTPEALRADREGGE